MRAQGGAIVLLGCASLCGCSYADGVRYSVDGTASFATTAAPPTGVIIQFATQWSSSGSGLDVGGSNVAVGAAPPTPIGPWRPTSDPRVFTFEVVVEVPRPSNGKDPGLAMGLELAKTSTSSMALGDIISQQVGDENDGWYAAHLVARFDCTAW